MNNHPLMCSSQGGFASVPPARASHDCHSLALQEEFSVIGAQSYEGKLRATVLAIQIRHFDGHTYAAKCLQFPNCVTTTFVAVF